MVAVLAGKIIFNLDSPLGQLEHLLIGNRKTLALGRFDPNALAAATPSGHRRINHFDIFTAQIVSDDCRFAFFQQRFENDKLVRRHRTLDHHLAQTVRTVDNQNLAKTGFGVNGEQDAARRRIAPNHFLNRNRESNAGLIKTLVLSVRNRPVVEERSHTLFDGDEERFRSDDVQKSILLTGKRSAG